MCKLDENFNCKELKDLEKCARELIANTCIRVSKRIFRSFRCVPVVASDSDSRRSYWAHGLTTYSYLCCYININEVPYGTMVWDNAFYIKRREKVINSDHYITGPTHFYINLYKSDRCASCRRKREKYSSSPSERSMVHYTNSLFMRAQSLSIVNQAVGKRNSWQAIGNS